MESKQLVPMSKIISAKKSGDTVRVVIIGGNEYIGTIESTIKNHAKMIQTNGEEVYLWVSSIEQFEVLDNKDN